MGGPYYVLCERTELIVWSDKYPKSEYVWGARRLNAARKRFGERLALAPKWPPMTRKPGDMARLEALRGTCADKEIIVLGNGPSLAHLDPELLDGRISIGSNGVYELFPKWGRTTDYLIMEDVEQVEERGKAFRDVPSMGGRALKKLAALHTAHALPRPWPDDLYFFNARYTTDAGYYDEWGPHFSEDFASLVWLGSTVTYISLQLAWYLGAKTVYLAGVDFSYGPLEAMFKPGKITITPENIDLVQQCHFIKDYHKVGHTIGVPHSARQRRAYALAARIFERDGRRIINLTPDTKLDVFKRGDMDKVLAGHGQG